MKKRLLIFTLLILVTVSIFADSDEKWYYKEGVGVYHDTWDFVVYNLKTEETLWAKDFENNKHLRVCFSTEYPGFGLIMTILYGSIISNEEIDFVRYGDDLDNTTAFFTPLTTVEGGFALKEKDSKFVYNDMLYGTQKAFAIFTENYMILFQCNCKNLYKYNSYLY